LVAEYDRKASNRRDHAGKQQPRPAARHPPWGRIHAKRPWLTTGTTPGLCFRPEERRPKPAHLGGRAAKRSGFQTRAVERKRSARGLICSLVNAVSVSAKLLSGGPFNAADFASAQCEPHFA
jgi:hypothetical protein